MTPETRGMTLEPNDLRLLGTAFDEAWETVAPDFVESDGPSVARARTELARIMLKLMELRQLDGEELKRTGVRIFRDEADSRQPEGRLPRPLGTRPPTRCFRRQTGASPAIE